MNRVLLPCLALLIGSAAFCADHNQTTPFGTVNPGQGLTATVTPPGTVISGNVVMAGGFQWAGGPSSWTTSVPTSFAGTHSGEFSGNYTVSGGTGGTPRIFSWDLKTTAESAYKRTPPGTLFMDPAAYSSSFGDNNQPHTSQSVDGTVHLKYNQSDDRGNANRKILVRLDFQGQVYCRVSAFRFDYFGEAAAAAVCQGSMVSGVKNSPYINITTSTSYSFPTLPTTPGIPVPVATVSSPDPVSSGLLGSASIWEEGNVSHAPNSVIDETRVATVFSYSKTRKRSSGRASASAIISSMTPTGGLTFTRVN